MQMKSCPRCRVPYLKSQTNGATIYLSFQRQRISHCVNCGQNLAEIGRSAQTQEVATYQYQPQRRYADEVA